MNPSNSASADPFFIGWKPVPPAYRRLLIPVALGLPAVLVVIAVLLGRGQQGPPGGAWDTTNRVVLTGIVYAEPYAMLRVAADPPRTVLLVSDGKAGAAELIRRYDGRPVRVTGTVLRSDGIRLLELEGEPEAVELSTAEQARLRRPDPRPGPQAVLTGEVVDSKCYLGAMRPGRGKGHRGCAALCLRGGVPPLFVVAGPYGEPMEYLMVGWAAPELVSLLGQSTELAVRVEWWDDLPVIRSANAATRP